jgi:adenosylcobinamide kinase/adenosylcobinamide-phosphate guanylyltransferase
MMVYITGGAGSGKSAYAEKRALALPGRPVYLAAMHNDGSEETLQRIGRHRKMRSGKGFFTMEDEALTKAAEAAAPGDTVLIEDLTNLLANRIWIMKDPDPVTHVYEALLALKRRAAHIVLVANEVFSDGITYDAETEHFLMSLSVLSGILAREADEVVEVVCGLPLVFKAGEGGKLC